jgi:cytochrome d ubiquinol oxidase subunit I
VAKNQPAKLAAFEGLYNTTSNAPLTSSAGWTRKMKRWSASKRRNVELSGAQQFSRAGHRAERIQAGRPPAGRGVVFLFSTAWWAGFDDADCHRGLGFLYFRHGSLHERRWLLWILVFSVLGPQIANQMGWFAAEVGRQPWIVYGVLRTPEGLSKICAGECRPHVADFVHVHLFSAVRRFHLSAQRQNPARAAARMI